MNGSGQFPLNRRLQTIRFGRRRLVLATIKNPWSFGVLLATIITGLRAAREQHANLYVLLSRPAVNDAVLCLESGGVTMAPPAWWKNAAGWIAWFVSGLVVSRPHRLGDVPSWLGSVPRMVYRFVLKRLAKHPRLSKPARGRIKERLVSLERRYWSMAAPPLAARADIPSVYDFRLDIHQLSAAPSPRARFPPPIAERAAKEAAGIGLQPLTPMVTLHVREAGFRPSLGLSERGVDRSRNAVIDIYRPAIDWLVARGYTVVRIGDRTMTPFAHPGVVDLAAHPARTDVLELWCIMHSRFYIGCDSGAIHAPLLTGTPRLLVNVKDPILTYPGQPRDLYIVKAVHDAKTGRRLSLREMLTTDFLARKDDLKRIDYRDNDAVEIADAVREMADALDASPPPSPSASQVEYRRLASAVIGDTIRINREAGIDCGPWQPGADLLGHGWIARGFADCHLDSNGPCADQSLSVGVAR